MGGLSRAYGFLIRTRMVDGSPLPRWGREGRPSKVSADTWTAAPAARSLNGRTTGALNSRRAFVPLDALRLRRIGDSLVRIELAVSTTWGIGCVTAPLGHESDGCDTRAQ